MMQKPKRLKICEKIERARPGGPGLDQQCRERRCGIRRRSRAWLRVRSRSGGAPSGRGGGAPTLHPRLVDALSRPHRLLEKLCCAV